MKSIVTSFAVSLFILMLCHSTSAEPNSSILSTRIAPGGDKTAYEATDYETNSLSLEHRRGQKADLLSMATNQHLGLPAFNYSNELKPNIEKIELGRRLFYDRQLSRNKTMSCAMCHIPEQGFTSNELKRPIGFQGRSVKRNAPSLLNVKYYQRFFVDARETSLIQQVWSPLLASNEMNNPSVGYVIEQLSSDTNYQQLFSVAFAEPPNMINVGVALAQYQQSLVSANSPFDKWFYGKQESAITKEQRRGFELFTGKAGCSKCHRIGQKNSIFTDQQLHNTGVGYRYSMLAPAENIVVTLAPGLRTTVSSSLVDQVKEPKVNDLGRYEVSLHPDDKWKFRTPNLRNIELTAPYMHNGEFLSLQDVVEYYVKGGEPHPQQSSLIQPLNLGEKDRNALIAFLHSLTSDDVAILVSDAFEAQVSDSSR